MASGFSFGVKTTPAPTLTTPTFSFGSSAQAPTLSLALPTAATPATGSLFSTPTPGAGLLGSTTTSTAPTLSFMASSNTTTTMPAATSGFGFGTATTTGNFGFGLPQPAVAAAAPSATTVSLGFGVSTAAATSISAVTTSTPVGLGGVATLNQSKVAVTTQKEVAPKDQPLPNEVLQTVEQLKEFVKQQKVHSSDISRCSIRDFRKVEQEIDQLSSNLNEIEKWLKKHRQMAEKLKFDTVRTVQSVEMAQRTHDTPPGLQYENMAPLKFFFSLADQFENDMQNLKVQIDTVEKFVKSHMNPDPLMPQDLAMGMRRLHETFVALAGRLQSVHTQVESRKESYMNIRKHLLQDNSNPFEKLAKGSTHHMTFVPTSPKVATGPTPFNALTLSNMTSTTAQQPTAQPPAYPGPNTSVPGTGFGTTGFALPLGNTQAANSSLFGSTSFNQSTSLANSFQLQKPPTGNKRGKI
ncbi:nuclear pore complex protein Nup58 [Euwallacea similis]|uniref:nuclear pore complex protein Nup58 n=1 Tax=Euwallacea similis TaxID=1736056 RepID=UPI00344D8E49